MLIDLITDVNKISLIVSLMPNIYHQGELK